MKISPILTFIFLFAFIRIVSAQSFTDITPSSFISLPLNGSAKWGDFDNDGKMELMYMGTTSGNSEPKMVLLKNDGSVFQIGFTSSKLAIVPSIGSMDNFTIADLDNDGDLDVVGYGEAIRIIRNTSNLNFEDSGVSINWPVEAAQYASSVYSGDKDQNGQTDLLITGRYIWGTLLNNNFRFNKGSSLADELGLGFVYQRWADMDGDGDLDILVSRNSYIAGDTKYKNYLMVQGADGSFSRKLQGASDRFLRNIEFADFDGDSDLDVLAKDDTDRYSVFRTDNMNLVTLGITFTANSAKWADFNNDGFVDIILTGTNTKILYNNQDGTFSDSGITDLPAFSSGAVHVADYDRDGDPDVCLTGENAGRIFRNNWIENGNAAAEMPPVPTELSVETTYNSALLQWMPGAGPVRPQDSYNLQVTSSSGSLVMPAHLASDQTTSILYEPGNAAKTTQYRLKGLADGTYHWRVQAMNGSFLSSSFSSSGTFTISGINPNSPGNLMATALSDTSIKLTWTDRCSSELEYKIYQKTDLPTSEFGTNYIPAAANASSVVVTNLTPETRYVFRVVPIGCTSEYENPAEVILQTFPPILKKVTSLLPPLNVDGHSMALAIGDYDNDGDQDLLANSYVSGKSVAVLYKYEDHKYVDSGIHFPYYEDSGSVRWIDYNKDGYLDLFFNFGRSISLYLNKQTSFVEAAVDIDLSNFFNIERNGISFADFNNDSNVDVLVSGLTTAGSTLQLFINTGKNKFVNSGADLGNIFLVSSADPWMDYDNDGFKDILVSRKTGGCGSMVILKNIDGKSLELRELGVDIGFRAGDGASDYKITDYDNDGLLDFALTGSTVCSQSITYVYRNGGNGSFQRLTTSLVAMTANVWLSWGDINNDGSSDLCSYGQPVTGSYDARLYWNTANGSFSDSQLELSRNVWGGAVALVDIDNDNDLDYISWAQALVGGRPVIETFINSHADGRGIRNQPPSAPQNLSNKIIQRGTVVLKWDEATDDKSSHGLTYNFYLIHGSDTIVQAYSLKSGKRKITAQGNIQAARSIKLQYLYAGKYTWAVQAIDQSFVGGSFSQQGSFELTGLEPDLITSLPEETISKVKLYPNPIEDELYIETANRVYLRVLDSNGREVMNTEINSDSRIPMQNLAPGLYFIEYNSNGVRIERFIKK